MDLSQVAGSGREGRITKQDVLAYVETRERGVEAAPAAAPTEEESAPLGAARQRRPVQADRRLAAVHRRSRARSGACRAVQDQQLHPLPLAPTSNWCRTPGCAS